MRPTSPACILNSSELQDIDVKGSLCSIHKYGTFDVPSCAPQPIVEALVTIALVGGGPTREHLNIHGSDPSTTLGTLEWPTALVVG